MLNVRELGWKGMHLERWEDIFCWLIELRDWIDVQWNGRNRRATVSLDTCIVFNLSKISSCLWPKRHSWYKHQMSLILFPTREEKQSFITIPHKSLNQPFRYQEQKCIKDLMGVWREKWSLRKQKLYRFKFASKILHDLKHSQLKQTQVKPAALTDCPKWVLGDGTQYLRLLGDVPGLPQRILLWPSLNISKVEKWVWQHIRKKIMTECWYQMTLERITKVFQRACTCTAS
jgi:hypothetical protein